MTLRDEDSVHSHGSDLLAVDARPIAETQLHLNFTALSSLTKAQQAGRGVALIHRSLPLSHTNIVATTTTRQR